MTETLFEYAARQPIFHGSDINMNRDAPRLTKQIKRVYDVMADGQWHSVAEVARITGDPETSTSAQIRNLRKKEFGLHTIEKRHNDKGFFEFRMEIKNPAD